MKYVTLAAVLALLYACSPRLATPERIDWSKVPADTEYREPHGLTPAQIAIRHEARIAYQFEHQPH